MRLHRFDLGHGRTDRALHLLGEIVRLLEREVAGEFQVERDLSPALDTQDGDVVHLAHARDAERRCLRALADAARFVGFDVHDHIAARECGLHGILDAVGGRVALAHRRPGGNADDDIGELAPAGLAHAQPF
jgi:hypothetical protein